MPSRGVCVGVDTAEQCPWLFPKQILVFKDFGSPPQVVPVKVKKLCLGRGDKGRGDYTLLGSAVEGLVGIERKGSVDELCHNVSLEDRDRFVTALRSFASAYKVPILWLDMLPLSIWSPSFEKADPVRAIDLVLSTCASLDISIVWGGRKSTRIATRRRLGEIALRLMIHSSGVLR